MKKKTRTILLAIISVLGVYICLSCTAVPKLLEIPMILIDSQDEEQPIIIEEPEFM
tara:strand:- start:425 stop:592 length:168 start_codon:yes stop_codon:yes gene_type:complete